MTMKKILLLIVTLMTTSTFATNFVEFRLGLQDNYHKEVHRVSLSTLMGDFKGTNFGLRFGKNIKKHTVYFEANPKQTVEIKSVKEEAKVQSYFVGYNYNFKPNFYAGGQIGHSSFELEKGPNGITFPDNPKTSGLTYGVNFGYKHNFNAKFYLKAGAVYNFGSYKTDTPKVLKALKSITITNQSQINLSVGWYF